MIDNKFYIAKKNSSQKAMVYAGYSWSSGSWAQASSQTVASTREINVKNYKKIAIRVSGILKNIASTAIYYWLGTNKEVIKIEQNMPSDIDTDILEEATYFAVDFNFTEALSNNMNIDYAIYVQVTPHYKSLKKQYKKESNQMFFRETLDGKINLFGQDYEYVKNCSIEDKLIFDIYQNGKKYITTTFNKTDCKFDHFRKSVELNLVANDLYTDILNKYENTYDIIKLAPARNWITLTKRCVVQIYVKGDNVISNYAGGTYWETDVDEAIDDETALRDKYHFSKGPVFREISLSGFNYNINTTYMCIGTDDCWNSNSSVTVFEPSIGKYVTYEIPCSIKFTKVASAGQSTGLYEESGSLRLSDGKTSAEALREDGQYVYVFDMYRIEIYTGANGTGDKIYQSDLLYGKDGPFTIAPGANLYPMTKLNMPVPAISPQPAKFNLGNNVIEYSVWARMLCDVEKLSDGQTTYDLPYDDFATPRANYRKCIGLIGFDSQDSVIKLRQSKATSDKPTSFGMNDFGRYFESPYTQLGSLATVYPLARSTWGNTSLWAIFETGFEPLNLFEKWCEKSYKQYTIKDCFNISNVIKVLLDEISGGVIKHEPTAEYSQFLYGAGNYSSSEALHNCQLYITQKTNILKGEYDQAAQKAELTLKDIMDMLRDCFRCYWYIDEQNRFIIEHVSYFVNGFSYENPLVGIDCTKLSDKFNKLNIQYCQHELEYNKSELHSRLEFEWMDESTDSMSNLRVDVLNEYIQKDNSESINPNKFSVDVDYMLFLPSEFSEDGFALLAADINGIVPISPSWRMVDNKQSRTDKIVTPQNYIVSWNQLIMHYMYDMPGNLIKYNNLPSNSIYVSDIRKCMSHNLSIQGLDKDLDITRTVKTSFGYGYIDSMSSNIDTRLITVNLVYRPS